MNQQAEVKTKDKNLTIGLMQFILYLVTLAVASMIFLAAFDRRIAVIETEMQYKVNEKQLFDRFEKMEDKLLKKLEEEISKIK